MPNNSAGILMYRRIGEGIEVLLVHPGGRANNLVVGAAPAIEDL
jgi:predicted NUDIX family NTP pyrophosphohydrolase